MDHFSNKSRQPFYAIMHDFLVEISNNAKLTRTEKTVVKFNIRINFM